MKTTPIYKETIYNYYVSIPFVVILLSLLAAIMATGGSIGLSIPFVIIGLLFIHIFKLNIKIYKHELHLILGVGWLKKIVQISDLRLSDFKEKPIPWYLKGTLFKWDYQGNIIFCPKSGKALTLEYKRGKQCVYIVTKDNRALFEVLRQYDRRND